MTSFEKNEHVQNWLKANFIMDHKANIPYQIIQTMFCTEFNVNANEPVGINLKTLSDAIMATFKGV
jgi:hypothetical protein